MRIVHITDQHVGEPDEQPYGVDVRSHFLALCRRIREIKPDYLVVTGDLSLTSGNAEIYQWIKFHLDQVGVPYAVLSGNHDDPNLLAHAFSLEDHLHDGELFYTRHWGGDWVLFLDSTPGAISDFQLDWLRRQLSETGGSPRLLFMHHPPVLAEVPHMDDHYPLLESSRRALSRIFGEYQGPIHVFCGHYHNAREVHQDGVHVYITPSSYLQIDPFQKDFAVDHTRPAFRYIDWRPSRVLTSVHYLMPR